MTEIRVDTIVDAAGTGAPNFTTAPTVGGAALGSLATSSFTSSASAPSSPSNGAVWWDTTNSALMIYANSAWQTVTLGVIPPGPAYFGDRMVFAYGNLGSAPHQSNEIKYYDLTASSASATDFGDLSATRGYISSASGEGRGLFIGGAQNSGGVVNTIEYVTIASAGNVTDFGDMSGTTGYSLGSASDGLKCIYSLINGAQSPLTYESIQSVTIDTAGNATAWSGTLTVSRRSGAAASDGTKGFFLGGTTTYSDAKNEIDYVTIATDANATDWGDLITGRRHNSACGNNDRILVGAGEDSGGSRSASIEYINPASASNAYSFGNLVSGFYYGSAACSETKAVFSNGSHSSGYSQMMQIVTIANTGNASNWGNSGAAGGAIGGAACSGAAS